MREYIIRKNYLFLDLFPSFSKVAFCTLAILLLASSEDIYAKDLWVDTVNGKNANSGLSESEAWNTIQRAGSLARPGDVVHVMPGVYRGGLIPRYSGTAAKPIRYVAEAGPGSAILRGSRASSSRSWRKLKTDTIGLPAGVDPLDIWYVNLAAWGLEEPPRYLVELDATGEPAQRLPLAREPDWSVQTGWKHHDYWWSADGGTSIADCNPTSDGKDCDSSARSSTELIDRNNDTLPADTEPGNLTTLGNITGATLVALDTVQGHDQYRRLVVQHDIPNGQIKLDQPSLRNGAPGLGWGTKYYVENLPSFLDEPGEWWFDQASGMLYLWPLKPGNPRLQDIEISRNDSALDLTDRSYIEVNGLTVEFYNSDVVRASNFGHQQSRGNVLRNVTLRYGENGIKLKQYIGKDESLDNSIEGFLLEDSEISHMDRFAITTDHVAVNAFGHAGVRNTVIRRNELHHLGFGYGSNGTHFVYADHFRFEDNHVHDVAKGGLVLFRSMVDSPKTFGFTSEEIKTGNILVKGNLFENICQNNSDCGALKLAGSVPDKHVFRDLLVVGNIFRDNFGWSSVGEKRGRFNNGLSGRGLYADNASGIHVYQNIAYNNGFAGFGFARVWRDGDIVVFNNVSANSLTGFFFAGRAQDTHINVNTQIANNVILNNLKGFRMEDADRIYDNTLIDQNLYFGNGWLPYEEGGPWGAGAMHVDLDGGGRFSTFADIKAGSDFESRGAGQNPYFQYYIEYDQDSFDGSWPSFDLTSSSPLVLERKWNQPDSLKKLLADFGIGDHNWTSTLNAAALGSEN